jgi:Sulfotransferase family
MYCQVEQKARRPLVIAEKIPLVFVVGCARSGTTLLSVMLDRHNDLAMTPETAFYNEIAPKMAKGVDIRRLLQAWSRLPELGLTADTVAARLSHDPIPAHLLQTILQMYAEKRCKPYCGEKTPQHLDHVPTLIRDFPGTRVVCMIRDGRDVVLSLRAMPWWSGSLRTGVNAYLAAIELSDRFAESFPEHFLPIRYEHLIDRPAQTLDTVMGFFGLDFQPGQLEPGPSDVVVARSLLWKGSALEAVDSGLADRRRSQVSAQDLKYLEKRLGPTLRRLGYQTD